MNSQNYIVCYKNKATDTDCYLFLQSKGRQNRKKKALGIKVNIIQFKNNWNEVDQRFMSGMGPTYKNLNAQIKKAFKEVEETQGVIVTQTSKDNNSFLKFWDRQLELTTNQGSKTKHESVKIKLEKYLTTLKKKDLLFSEITPDFVEQLKHYFKTAKDPNTLSSNSVTHYLKIINSIINRKLKKEPYALPFNPFKTIDYDQHSDIDRRVLTLDELSKLKTVVITNPNLDITRYMFLFQVYAQGMRVSDMLLLRWGTIISTFNVREGLELVPTGKNYDPQLNYVMFKTYKPMKTDLNYMLCKILMKSIGMESRFNEILDGGLINGYHYGMDKSFTLTQLQERIDNFCVKTVNPKEIKNYSEYGGYSFKNDNEREVKELIDVMVKVKQNLIKQVIEETAIRLSIHKIEKGNTFVFPILNNADFINLPEKDKEFKEQIKITPELYRAYLVGHKTYQHRLDDLSKLVGINRITTHTSRHTYTQLMIYNDTNTYRMQEQLGHSTLGVLENYVNNKDFKPLNKVSVSNKIGNDITDIEFQVG